MRTSIALGFFAFTAQLAAATNSWTVFFYRSGCSHPLPDDQYAYTEPPTNSSITGMPDYENFCIKANNGDTHNIVALGIEEHKKVVQMYEDEGCFHPVGELITLDSVCFAAPMDIVVPAVTIRNA